MKPASDALRALLAAGQFAAADLYTFTLVDGAVLRYTSFDTDVIANGSTHFSGDQGAPLFDRQDNKAKVHWKIGVEVDTLEFDVIPNQATVNGLPFLWACRLGVFDGAELQLERAFMPPPARGYYPPAVASVGTVILFVGRVAEVDLGRSLATFNVNSHLELLNTQLPRNLFQSTCVNSLYDTACGVSRAAYLVGGTSAAGSTVSVVKATLAQAMGWFDQGSITFTSGQNKGFSRTVKTYTAGSPGTLSLIAPFPFAPAAGDTFTALPGCDKTTGPGGCEKFNNVPRFKGFSFVPIVETAL